MVTSPDRIQEELRVHACITIRGGKPRVWNRAGGRGLTRAISWRESLRQLTPAQWCGEGQTSPQQLKILGRHRDTRTSWRVICRVARKQQVLLDRIPGPDVQSTWVALRVSSGKLQVSGPTVCGGEFCQEACGSACQRCCASTLRSANHL